jgi:hypothetical protein
VTNSDSAARSTGAALAVNHRFSWIRKLEAYATNWVDTLFSALAWVVAEV